MQSCRNLQHLKSLSVELRELDLGNEIQRVAWPLTPLQFYREYVSKNKPCVLTGAIDHWPALKLWNQQYLAEKLAARQVTVAVTPNGQADAVCDVSVAHDRAYCKKCFMLPCQRDVPFTEFMDHAAHGSTASHADCKDTQQECMGSGHSQPSTDRLGTSSEVMYLQQQDNNLRTSFPELVHEVDEELQWASEAFGAGPEAVNLWIGNDRSVTSFHKDHYENLYAVVAGEKVFTLLPPSDSYRMQLQKFPVATYQDTSHGLQAVLEPDSTVLWSPIEDLTDGSAPATQQQCPLYADPELPEPLRVIVRPGELLFLPSLWWHQVEQRAGKDGLVIAVNYWYDMKFDCKYAYYKLVEAVSNGANVEDSDDDPFERQT